MTASEESRAVRRTPIVVFVLRAIAAYAGFAIAMLYCAWRVVVGRLRGDDNRSIARDTARLMSRLICPAAGVRVLPFGADAIERAQPCVYVANHQSFLDYPILASVFPQHTVVVGKSEMGRIPLIGWLFTATGNVLLTRRDAREAHGTLEALADRVRTEGISVWFFPEGTRNRSEAPLLPFRTGAFRLAQQAGVPIVPVVVSAQAPNIDLARRQAEPSIVSIHVLAPRVIGPHDDVRAFADATRAAMLQCLVGGSEHG